MKKNLSKKIFTFILLSALSTVLPAISVDAAEIDNKPVEAQVQLASAQNIISPRVSVVNIALYRSWAFTKRSTPEYIELQEEANSVSIEVYCEDPDVTDNLVCNIIATNDGNDYAQHIPCCADGIVDTIALYVPKGEYKVNFEDGDPSINKVKGFVVFSVVD